MAKKKKKKKILTPEQAVALKKLEVGQKALQGEHDTLYRMEGGTTAQRSQVDVVLAARTAVAGLEAEYEKLFIKKKCNIFINYWGVNAD